MEGEGMKKLVALVLAAAGALVSVALLVERAAPPEAGAADHLDAPGLTPPGGDLRTDITDVYTFKRGANTVLVMNVNGLTKAGMQATFASSAPSVMTTRRVTYNFRVDNNGDAVADVVLGVKFGRVGATGAQSMEVRRNGRLLVAGRTSKFGRAVINRSRPAAAPVAPRLTGGAAVASVKAFAGMRDDPFFFDLNGFINILSNEPGKSFIGCQGTRPDFFAGTNVSSIVVELPSRLLTRRSPNIGVWATTDRGGEQIDRMGRPAIATVFIPSNPFEKDEPSQKNAYNETRPRNDEVRWTAEVVDTLTVLHSLNDSAGDNKADDAGKIAALAGVILPDVLTIDVSDPSGFLNGRRLADDVIDAELALITEGAVTTDCVSRNDKAFSSAFPYLAGPHA
jgi:hypothetical protein